ncbi:MAG: tripartite tricarboxylate transporter substrate binding protein [Acetobacteraceae bacterium]|nr:tripartite tricarboxylate transporter substrate binding protein [Acetobacteraceae bacterium]MDW8397975.1 tripartite tricarboxylate transporter substrate binding protein [Acetobacteraceae bacterium]
MIARRLVIGAALAAPALGPARGQAPQWPQRPVRFIVSLAAGGLLDLVARLLAEPLGELWGHPVVVENRPGAGGQLATRLVARAAPDGHSALVTGSSFAINLSVSRNPGYVAEDLVPAAVVADTPTLVIVRADSPIRTLQDLLETARRRPVSFGTPGVGTAPHLSGELFFRRAGAAEATHVPYAGTAPSMTALLAGDIDVVLGAAASVLPLLGSGRARALAVMNDRRSQVLPDVPTLAEAGAETIVDITWIALFLPAGTPRAVLERVNTDVLRVMQRPAVRERLAALALEPIGGDLAAAQALVTAEVARWREVVRVLNIQQD